MPRLIAVLALAALMAACSDRPTAPASAPELGGATRHLGAANQVGAVHPFAPSELTEYGRFFWESAGIDPCTGLNVYIAGWTVLWAKGGVNTPSGNTNIPLVLTFEDVTGRNLDTGEPYNVEVRVVQHATEHMSATGGYAFHVRDNEFWSDSNGRSWTWHISYTFRVASDGTVKTERSTGTCRAH